MKLQIYGSQVYVEVEGLKIPSYYHKDDIDGDLRQMLFASFAEEGIKEPLIINEYPGREGTIIHGVQRYLYAKRKGILDVPYHPVYADEDLEERLHYALSANTSEYPIDELIEYLRSSYGSYFDEIKIGLADDPNSPSFVPSNPDLQQIEKHDQPRRKSFLLRLSSEYSEYPQKLMQIYGLQTQNEALTKLIIDAVEGRINLCY